MVDYEGFIRRFVGNDRRMFLILLAAMIFIISVLTIVDEWGDVKWYWMYGEDMLRGHVPYIPSEEYPPFAYPPMFLYICTIPAMFTDTMQVYGIIFLAFSGALVLLAAHLSLKMCDEYGVSHIYVYIAFMLLLACEPVHILDRNDSMATVLLIIASYFFMKKRAALCFILIAISTMIKIYPGLVLAAFLLPYLINRDWKGLFGYGFLAVAVCVLIQLPCCIAFPDDCFNYITQNTGRLIQIEACIGPFLTLCHYISPDAVWVEETFGSQNYYGAIPEAIAPVMLPLMVIGVACMCAFLIVKLWRKRMDNTQSLTVALMASILLILVFLLFNKVYSAQYGVWVIMLFAPILILLAHQNVEDRTLTVRYIIFSFASLLATIFYSGELSPFFFVASIIKVIALVMLLIECVRLLSSYADKKLMTEGAKPEDCPQTNV